MIELTERERDEIAQLYVVANTPLMLYTALSASVAVQEVLCSRPQSDLVSLYASLGNISSPDEFGVSLSYATLVAILIKHGREGGPGDLPIDAGRLKWGAQMERYSRAREVNTGMLDIDAGYDLHGMTPSVDGPVSVVEAETQTTEIVVPFRPNPSHARRMRGAPKAALGRSPSRAWSSTQELHQGSCGSTGEGPDVQMGGDSDA